MIKDIRFQDLGIIKYDEALNIQNDLFQKKIKQKLNGEYIDSDFLICVHPHVYTLGNSGNSNNLLVNDDFLRSVNASCVKTNRGGDITYHGPGQLVIYPIIDLDNYKIGTKDYIYKLEYAVIDLLKDYGISGELSNGNIGVWLDEGSTKVRKICSIGVKVSRGITMHGLALNINTDLRYFDYINPCGFTDKGVTSVKKELGTELDFESVKIGLINILKKYFKALEE